MGEEEQTQGSLGKGGTINNEKEQHGVSPERIVSQFCHKSNIYKIAEMECGAHILLIKMRRLVGDIHYLYLSKRNSQAEECGGVSFSSFPSVANHFPMLIPQQPPPLLLTVCLFPGHIQFIV